MERRKYLFFIIYFIVQYRSPCMTMRSSNWNRYRNLSNSHFSPFYLNERKEGKNRTNFLQFSKRKTANERGFCDCSKNVASIVKQIKQIYIRMCFFRLQARICLKCHDTENELLFLLDSIIIEINYSEPRFGRFVSSTTFLASQLHKICSVIYALVSEKCNKTLERIMTKWTGNMRNFRDDVIKMNLSSFSLLV